MFSVILHESCRPMPTNLTLSEKCLMQTVGLCDVTPPPPERGGGFMGSKQETPKNCGWLCPEIP